MLQPYTLLIKILIAGLILGTAFFFGHHMNEQKWLDRVKEMEQKVAVAEQKSHEVNTVVETKIVEKIKLIKENKDANKETAKLISKQLNDSCSMPQSTVMLINSASQNEVARSAVIVDGSTSNVGTSETEVTVTGTKEPPIVIRASDVLETVVENYAKCNEFREKIISWQEWYRQQKKIFEESQK
jgi:predicted metal-dependent RNase